MEDNLFCILRHGDGMSEGSVESSIIKDGRFILYRRDHF